MIDKLECTCIEAYTKRNMRDPNCCACSCDHNDLVEQLAKANERVEGLEKEIQNIAASIGAGATIEDICNILDGYDSVKQLRKGQSND